MAKARLRLTQTMGRIMKLHRTSAYKPVAPVEIFKAQARGATLYGAERWGHCSTSDLVKLENSFMRQIIGLPRSTPLVSLRMDLGMRPIDEEIALRPLTFWHRVWVTPELSSYKAELKELLPMLNPRKIPWLSHIRDLFARLGKSDLWSTQELSCSLISRSDLVKLFRHSNLLSLQESAKEGRLTVEFLQVKEVYRKEHFLVVIHPPMARKLHLQFRLGNLPLAAHTSKWAPENPSACPACNSTAESKIHVLFFCHAYALPRKRWIIQLCKNLGFVRCLEAYRVLKYDTDPPIVFAVSRFLNAMWHIRRGFLK